MYSSQYVIYDLGSYLADIGGYLGLLLGYSLHVRIIGPYYIFMYFPKKLVCFSTQSIYGSAEDWYTRGKFRSLFH